MTALAPEARTSRRHMVVVGLLFLVALINYFDRQSLSVVAPRFQAELQLSDQGYAHIVSLFLFASAVAYAISGFISDALGTRRSMVLFVGWWSLAEACTAFAGSVFTLGLARFCLGLGEPGLWVAAPKAVAETLPKPQRGIAIGVYTMGATVGAVVAIPTIAAVVRHLPWKSIFILDGAVGLLWLPLWLIFYRPETEAAGGVPETALSVKGSAAAVLRRAAMWRLLIARGLTDPVWYFLLFWFPKYLQIARGQSLSQLAKLGWIVYLAAGVGTLLGGYLAGRWIRGGLAGGLAYRRVMLIAAVLVPLSPLAALAPTAALAVAVASVIALAHMAWLVNLTSTIVELFPAWQVGKAAGLIAAGSGFGGMLSSEAVGWLVTHRGYTPVFFIMALLHPIAITLLWTVFRDDPAPHAWPTLEMPSVAR